MSGAVAFVVTDIVKRYGTTTVLDEVSLSIHERTKVGVIGRNGAGKSTLIRLLLEEEQPDSGSIARADGLRVGYLEQHDAFALDETAGAFLERHTGREEWRCGKVAHRFGLTQEDLHTTMGELSGGYRTRVKLTSMLLADPDVLLLDEPTNFLDLSTVLLLQDFLADFRGGVLVVSHDREFLRRSCDHTLLVEHGELTLYPGDVEEFFSWKAEQLDLARRTNAQMEAKRKHLQSFIDRFGAKNTKATQAKSKQKQIERLQPITIANPMATARIPLPSAGVRPGFALAAEELTIGYEDHAVARDVRFTVDYGDKVAIVGDNGQGKTTLLRTLAGDLPLLGGEVRLAHSAEISYYAQHVYQALAPEDSVYDHLQKCAPAGVTRQAILAMAGSMLFRGDDVEKRVSVLSGGERARLCLAGLLLAAKPVLILDEPTNHLDFETVEALGDALRDFDGAVLFVSHDRTFVNMAATQIVEVDRGRVRRVPGSYADYVEELQSRARDSARDSVRDRGRRKSAGDDATAAGDDTTATESATTPAKAPPRATRESDDEARSAPLTAKEVYARDRRLRNARRTAERRLRDVEARMERLDADRARIEAGIAADPTDAALYEQLARVTAAVAEAESAWLEATAELESLPA